ncbi:hypothetical protein Pve01_71260 [Planomonospora venezuelensis]|nr:hypothetical protein Pve01_71260 [Planomonospora venezuelensis]
MDVATVEAASTVTTVVRSARLPFIVILPSGRVREAGRGTAALRPLGGPASVARTGDARVVVPACSRYDAAAVSLGGF